MAMFSLIYALLISSALLNVRAIPRFDGALSQSSISNLVGPAATFIEALPMTGAQQTTDKRTRHLSMAHLGQPGNLTVAESSHSPPLFYIFKDQLWQYNNETSILQVNAINSTEASVFPLQLVAETKTSRLKDGSWRWRGTMLYYDQGPLGNSGLYYHCRLPDGSSGLFMYLKAAATPENCEAYTLHTWSRSHIDPYNS